jgi:hypothetical protein
MSRITQIALLSLGILLLISAGLNVVQYQNRKPPVVETVTVRDTISRIDTVVRVVTNRVVVEKPVPVQVDTTTNIRVYRDTIYHPYGQIRREETVFGELVKKEIDFDLNIPEITRTITVNQVTTNTIRSRLLYANVGIRSDYLGQAFPTMGATYILKDHKIMFGADYGLDKSISARIGFSIIK